MRLKSFVNSFFSSKLKGKNGSDKKKAFEGESPNGTDEDSRPRTRSGRKSVKFSTGSEDKNTEGVCLKLHLFKIMNILATREADPSFCRQVHPVDSNRYYSFSFSVSGIHFDNKNAFQ